MSRVNKYNYKANRNSDDDPDKFYIINFSIIIVKY